MRVITVNCILLVNWPENTDQSLHLVDNSMYKSLWLSVDHLCPTDLVRKVVDTGVVAQEHVESWMVSQFVQALTHLPETAR